MEQFLKLTGEEINAIGNEGYRLKATDPETEADELPFGINSVVLTFVADGKDILKYTVSIHADRMDELNECVGKQPIDVFVKIWQLNH